MVLEKTLESPLDCKEFQPVRSEGDQPWDFFGRTDAKAETPVLWPPHAKSLFIGKDSDAVIFFWYLGLVYFFNLLIRCINTTYLSQLGSVAWKYHHVASWLCMFNICNLGK